MLLKVERANTSPIKRQGKNNVGWIPEKPGNRRRQTGGIAFDASVPVLHIGVHAGKWAYAAGNRQSAFNQRHLFTSRNLVRVS